MLSFSSPPKLGFLFARQLISDLTGVCCTRFEFSKDMFISLVWNSPLIKKNTFIQKLGKTSAY